MNKLTLEKDDEYAYRLTLNTFTGNEIYDYNHTTTINSNEIRLTDTVTGHVAIISPTNIKLTNTSGYTVASFDYMRMFYQGATSGYIYYDEIVTKKQLPTKTSELTNDSGYQTASDVSTAVSTAISGQTKETLQFVLSDGTTITKTFVLG